ncbi:MAG TPA: hypothetical protein PKG95_07685 [Anaerolineaceae bacterium]|nr:hypothetical protein [Anaerolineaceae bacterium]
MAETDLFFSFHHIAALVVDTSDPLAREFFQAEYGPHLGTGREYAPSTGNGSEGGDLPRIHLRFRRAELFAAPAGYVDHVHKLAARWAYRAVWHAGNLELDCIGNRFSIPMIHHMLVHPSLRLLCANRGVLLLHAGAVSCGGHSLLFTGQGGAGKTTTTALLMAYSAKQWAPHADDYTFLGPGPVSLAYLTRSHLYFDLLRWIPALKHHLSRGEWIRLAILGRVRSWSGDRIKWPVRLPLTRLWPGRTARLQANPAGLIFLRRGNIDRPLLELQQPGEAERDELLKMNFYEARHYLALMAKCGGLDPDRLDNWRRKEMDLIDRALQEIPVYRLTLPDRRITAAEFGPHLAEILDGRFAFSEED